MIVAKVTIFLKQIAVYTLQIIILFTGKEEEKKVKKKIEGSGVFCVSIITAMPCLLEVVFFSCVFKPGLHMVLCNPILHSTLFFLYSVHGSVDPKLS